MVEFGADVNSIGGKNKRTPLHNACAHNRIHLNIANYLLDCGADPTIKDKFGKTPISILEHNCTLKFRIASSEGYESIEKVKKKSRKLLLKIKTRIQESNNNN